MQNKNKYNRKKKRLSSIYAFNIFELENEEKNITENTTEANNVEVKEGIDLLLNPNKTDNRTYKSVSVYMRNGRKNKKEELSTPLLEIKKKLAKLYSLYECCYFMLIFRVDAKTVNNLFKKKLAKDDDTTLNDFICIYDDEGLAEIKNSWILSIDKRLILHENLFNFLKQIADHEIKY